MGSCRRRDNGQPLREAMKAASMSLTDLARATRVVDGRGVSYQLIAFLATGRPYARETTSARTAGLIEEALGAAPGSLFTTEED